MEHILKRGKEPRRGQVAGQTWSTEVWSEEQTRQVALPGASKYVNRKNKKGLYV